MTARAFTVIPGGRDATARRGCPAEVSPRALRASFAEGWPAFLAEVWGPVPATRSAEIATAFGVTDRAARDWIDGTSGPRGAAVVIAARLAPAAATRHLGLPPMREAA